MRAFIFASSGWYAEEIEFLGWICLFIVGVPLCILLAFLFFAAVYAPRNASRTSGIVLTLQEITCEAEDPDGWFVFRNCTPTEVVLKNWDWDDVDVYVSNVSWNKSRDFQPFETKSIVLSQSGRGNWEIPIRASNEKNFCRDNPRRLDGFGRKDSGTMRPVKILTVLGAERGSFDLWVRPA